MSVADVAKPLMMICLFALPPVAMAVWPSDEGAVVVMGSRDALALVVEAGGQPLSTSDDGRAVVTQSAAARSEGFVARLFRAGARVVLASPSRVGCTSMPMRTFSSADSSKG